MTTQELNALYIGKQMVAAGCTLAGAAGAIGNMQTESGIYSCRIQGDMTYPFTKSENYIKAVMNGTYKPNVFYHDGVGVGLVQWTYHTRKAALLSFCRETGQYLGDVAPQTQFLIKELKESYPGVWQVLCSSNDVEVCAVEFMIKFERPANQTTANRWYRADIAKNWYDFLVDNIDASELPPETVVGVPVTEYWPPRTIDKTMKGQDVAVLQAILMARGYYTAGIDSHFGETTEEALINFQQDHGLVADGIAGPKSWAALLGVNT